MEIWKDIIGFEGYKVSNTGLVKSLEKKRNFGRGFVIFPEKILKFININKNYLRVGLSKNGKTKMFQVHRLVAQAFIPNPNNYPIVMHKDDNPTNNNVDNLMWGTKQMNSKDMANKGRARNQYTSNI